MRIQTKRNLLRAATLAAALSAAAIVLLPAAAIAAPATASTTSNVRSGPSTNAGIVGRLGAGQSVDVGGCRDGWCYITSPTRGFVSASLLRSGGRPFAPNFNLSFNFPSGSFTIGSGGVSIGIGNPAPPRPGPGYPGGPGHPGGPGYPGGPGHPGGPGFPGGPVGPGGPGGPGGFAEACFYTDANYRGPSFCMERGEQYAFLGRDWNDRISSIRNQRGLRVEVCVDANYRDCRTYTTSAASLGRFDRAISSVRVR